MGTPVRDLVLIQYKEKWGPRVPIFLGLWGSLHEIWNPCMADWFSRSIGILCTADHLETQECGDSLVKWESPVWLIIL